MTMHIKPSFYDFTLPQLEEFLTARGEKKFRASQLFKWVYAEQVRTPDNMTNLAKTFRASLPDLFNFELLKVISEKISKDGTRKYLFDVGEGMSVESVLIPGSGGRLTLCVSSEVGCNLACKFCFTGKQKLKKRLSAGEIVSQFYQIGLHLPEDQKITNIVFMGMGEPLDNPQAVFDSIDILTSDHGFSLSRKKITVSTSGIVPMIPLITKSGTRLAVSLNGSNDEVRSSVMPINKKWPINKLLEACSQHAEATKQKVTFEYVLLKGVTDKPEHAAELYNLTKKIPCKINIIPFNEHPDSGYLRPEDPTILKFQNKLINLGAQVLLRKTMGRDIYAACGQLTTLKNENKNKAISLN